VFREHYKQLGSPLVCAEFDADNFDRVTAKVQDWVASQVPSDASTTNPSPRRRWNASRGPADALAGDAADLNSELIKAGGSALSQTAPEAGGLLYGNWNLA
jgi:hypothetical protein